MTPRDDIRAILLAAIGAVLAHVRGPMSGYLAFRWTFAIGHQYVLLRMAWVH